MTTATQSMPGPLTPPSERQLAAVARAVHGVIAPPAITVGQESPRVAALAALESAVTEYSQHMRRIGQYPEKALVAVKSTVHDIATPIGLKPIVDALTTQAAQWCISAYFDVPSMESGAK